MHFSQIKQKKMHWNALYLRKRLSHNYGKALTARMAAYIDDFNAFPKGWRPPSADCNFIFCLVPTCFDDILMVFWWYFYGILMIILSYFIIFCWDLQAKNCPPPPDVSLFDAFFSNKTEENALKCTIPQEKAFPYGRSQKLTPPQNVILFDAFFLKG